MSSIPKIIHFIWIDFSNELNPNPIIPEKYVKNINTTRQVNSEFQIKIWNGLECDQLVKKYFPSKYKLYWDLSKPIMRCDFARLAILYIYGGIYSDIDRIAIRSYDNILVKYPDYDFIIGKVDFSTTFNLYAFINDVMFAKPKCDFVLQCLLNIQKKNIPIETINIFLTAGPDYIKSIFNSYSGPSKIIAIYPELNSCNSCSCSRSDLDKLVSYTTFDGTWNSKTYVLKTIEYVYCNIYKFAILLLIGWIIFLKIK